MIFTTRNLQSSSCPCPQSPDYVSVCLIANTHLLQSDYSLCYSDCQTYIVKSDALYLIIKSLSLEIGRWTASCLMIISCLVSACFFFRLPASNFLLWPVYTVFWFLFFIMLGFWQPGSFESACPLKTSLETWTQAAFSKILQAFSAQGCVGPWNIRQHCQPATSH